MPSSTPLAWSHPPRISSETRMVMGLRTRVLILGCDAGAAVRGYIVSNSSLASEAAVDCGSGCVASVAEDAADWLGASLSRRGLRRGAIERRSVATATLLCNDGGVASVTGIFGKHNKIHLIHLCSMMQHHRNQNIAAVIIRNHHEAYQHHGGRVSEWQYSAFETVRFR